MNDEDMKEMLRYLGKAIKTARLSAGKRQSDIISATGLSKNILTSVETGCGSATSSLLVILTHLNLYDDVIMAIEANTGSLEQGRQRVRPPKPKVVNVENLAPGATEQELTTVQGDIIKLSDALKDDELLPALKANPNYVYRINKNLASELTNDPVHDIALYANTIRYKTPSGSIHQREVYYATTLQKASTTNLNWSVSGLIRRPNAVVNAVIALSANLANKGKDNAESLLFTLRNEFNKFNIFVDSITFCEASEEKQSHLRKGDREVQGESHNMLFNDKLSEWFDEIKT